MSIYKEIKDRLNGRVGENGRTVIKNSVFAMFGSVLGQLIALLSSLVMGRLTGASGLGAYTFAMTFAGIIFIFLNFGLGGIFEKNISQDWNSAEKNYANGLFLRLFISLPLSIVIGTGGAFIMQRQEDIFFLVLACIYTGLTGVFSLASGGINATERFDVTFIFSILQKVLCFAVTFSILYFYNDMLLMLMFHNVVFILLIVVELWYVDKHICRVRVEFDISFCRKMLKESFPTIFGAAAEYISLKSDILVLSLILGNAAAGLYSVSSNIYIAASFIPLAMAKAATPTFNRLLSERRDVSELVKKTFYMMTLSSVILIVGIILLGSFAIVLLWGKGFEEAAIPLMILSVSLLFMPANRFLEYMLIGLNRQVFVAKCSTVGAVFNILANIMMLPIIGMNAVALSTVITEAMVLGLEYRGYMKVIRRG